LQKLDSRLEWRIAVDFEFDKLVLAKRYAMHEVDIPVPISP
jgi:hypothetical protein